MSWSKPKTIVPFEAGALIEAFRIVKFGASDTLVVKGAASSDDLIGIPHGENDTASGKTLGVTVDGIEQVKLGGTVTRGQKLTSDANGKAVVAAPGSGANAKVIGLAWGSGVLDDVIPCLLKQGEFQGA